MIEIKYLRPELLEAIARNTLKKYDESLVSGYDAKEVPIEEIIESMGLSLEYQYIRNNGRIGMIFIQQVYEDVDMKSDCVRCPSCKRGTQTKAPK